MLNGVELRVDSLELFACKRIKEYIEVEGMSTYMVADVCGVSRRTLNNYLEHKTSPSLVFIERFCDFLCITQECFYEPYDGNHKSRDMAELEEVLQANHIKKAACIYKRRKQLA